MQTLLERMTWPEAKAALERGVAVVIPVGSTEQHGHHLPLSTDTINVYALARLAAERSGQAVVTPPVAFGTAHNHMHFPGTITLQLDTLKALLVDVAASLIHHGFHRLLLLNGHGGNISAVGAAAEQIREAFPQCRLGVIGDACLATRAKGEAVVTEAVATLCAVLAELAA